MDMHIIIATGQQIPNILPVLEFSKEGARVIVCTSKTMAENAERLKKVINSSNGFSCSVKFMEDEETLEKLREFFENVRNVIPSQIENVYINLTGGKKIMTIAAYEVFRGDNKIKIGYVDTIGKNYPKWVPVNKGTEKRELKERNLKIEHFLKLYGKEIDFTIYKEVRPNPKSWKPAEINFLKKVKDFDPKRKDLDKSEWSVYKKIWKKNPGLWLEYYVYRLLYLNKEKWEIADLATSVSIEDAKINVKNNKVKNELDVVFIHKNQFYMLECKTAGKGSKIKEISYRNETVSKELGARTNAWLIAPGISSAGLEVVRAELLGHKVFCNYKKVGDLDCEIRKFFENK